MQRVCRIWSAIVVLLCSGAIGGCTARVGSLTLASTKNLGAAYPLVRHHVRGEDCARSVLFIPWGSLNPNVQDAVDAAVAEAPGADMLTNAVVHDDLFVTVFYNSNCIRVDGDAVNSTGTR